MVYYNHALYITKLLHTYTQVEKDKLETAKHYIHIYVRIYITYIIYAIHIVYTYNYKLYVIYVKFYVKTPFSC